MSTTLLALDEKLLEAIGDFKQHLITTAINADVTIVSTHLQNYRSSADYFNNHWIYIEDKANEGISRQIIDDDGTSTLTLRAPNLLDDGANLATFRISRYSWEDRQRAIIAAVEECRDILFRNLDIRTLITGNILSNSHFEDWVAIAVPDNYLLTNVIAVASTGIAEIRGGAKSAKVTANAADGYLYIKSTTWPRLLDLMGKTITFKCWAYPQVTDDAFLTIYTTKADGTTQTLNSTTTCPAGQWTLLELKDQVINDDITYIEFRFRVHTNAKYVFFDAARVTGRDLFEYLLPTNFVDGELARVYIQTTGYSDQICDDLHPRHWEAVYNWQIMRDGTNEFLRLPELYTSGRQIRLIGTYPLESLSAATNALAAALTISLDGEKLNLLIAYAKYKLFQMQESIPSSEDISRFERASAKAYGEYLRLRGSLRMVKPYSYLNLG